jgi:hypothetical protein
MVNVSGFESGRSIEIILSFRAFALSHFSDPLWLQLTKADHENTKRRKDEKTKRRNGIMHSFRACALSHFSDPLWLQLIKADHKNTKRRKDETESCILFVLALFRTLVIRFGSS